MVQNNLTILHNQDSDSVNKIYISMKLKETFKISFKHFKNDLNVHFQCLKIHLMLEEVIVYCLMFELLPKNNQDC